MPLAFILLLLLIGSVLASLPVGSTMTTDVEIAIVAAGLVAVAVTIRPGDARHASRATAGLRAASALAVAILILQLLPLPLALSHPIWASAAEALQTQSLGHVTVELGMTLRALFCVLAIIGAAWTTIAVAKDRRRAQLLLFAAAAVATLMSLAALVLGVVAAPPLVRMNGDATIFNGLGIILCLATLQLFRERKKTRHLPVERHLALGASALGGVLVNAAAWIRSDGISGGMAIAVGVAVLLLAIVIRRIGSRTVPAIILSAITLIAVVIVTGYLSHRTAGDFALLRFLPALSADTGTTIERMLADIRWLGSGAGTFTVLQWLYLGAGQQPFASPSAAIALSIELGWIGLSGLLFIAAVLVVKLMRGALRRGRDWTFPAAAAACIATACYDGLLGPGLLQPSAAILLAIVIGLGMAQSISQVERS